MDDFIKSLKKDNDNLRICNVTEVNNPESNSSGSYKLDHRLGNPFPEGGIVEVYGSESSMKTTLSLSVIGEALKKGKHCAYINMERSINQNNIMNIKSLRDFVESVTTDKELFQFLTPTTGEMALNLIKSFVTNYPGCMVVLDSVDACVPEALLAEAIGTIKMGNHAKLMSDALRKLVPAIEETKSTVIFINQIRSSMTSYGNPNQTGGGAGLRFYCHQRIELLKPGKAQVITDSDGKVIGTTLRYKIAKNKYMPAANEEGEIPILYNYGIFDTQELIEYCTEFGFLTQGGKGGKQINMPSWDEATNTISTETKCMSKLAAARLLILDQRLNKYYKDQVQDLLKPVLTNSFLNEST